MKTLYFKTIYHFVLILAKKTKHTDTCTNTNHIWQDTQETNKKSCRGNMGTEHKTLKNWKNFTKYLL